MKKRSVLIIGPTPPPVGGDTVSMRKLLESAYWSEFGLKPVHINTSRGDRIRVATEPLRAWDIVRGADILMRILSKLPGSDVVLFCASSRFLCTVGLPIMAAVRLARKPLAVKIFGTFLGEFMRALPASRRRLVIGALSRAEYIFPQTEEMVDEFVRELGLPAERVVCLPNYVTGDLEKGGSAKERFGGRCVFVGQIKREKGIFDMIEALAGREDFTCDCYGPVLERDREAFLGAAEASSNVRYRGIIPPDDVRSVIAGYDLLVLPTYHNGEGYPAVILESFAAGVPVVTTEWKSIPVLAPDGERGLLVPVRSPGKLREALERLARDDGLYRALSRNAAGYVRTFSERAVVRDVLLERLSRLAR